MRTEKVRYEVDPYNRLVVDRPGRKTGLARFRKVLCGEFKTDEFNNLSYNVKLPLSDKEEIPNQIMLKGEWSLADNHRLRLTLNKTGRDTLGDQLILDGQILDTKGDSLLFAVTTTTKDGTQSTYVVNLSGSWKADDSNRLSFHARRERGSYDILTLTGVWDIDREHNIIYQYEDARLIRKKSRTHTLTFKGHWDIKEKYRISYILSGATDSSFDFNTAAGIFREDYIKYELAIGAAFRPRPAKRAITLSGRWRFKKDAGLIFEIECERGKPPAIIFGADARLADNGVLRLRIKDALKHKDIGVELELSRGILEGDGEAFLKLLASGRETAIYAGAAKKW